jgi:hypothetical protein
LAVSFLCLTKLANFSEVILTDYNEKYNKILACISSVFLQYNLIFIKIPAFYKNIGAGLIVRDLNVQSVVGRR